MENLSHLLIYVTPYIDYMKSSVCSEHQSKHVSIVLLVETVCLHSSSCLCFRPLYMKVRLLFFFFSVFYLLSVRQGPSSGAWHFSTVCFLAPVIQTHKHLTPLLSSPRSPRSCTAALDSAVFLMCRAVESDSLELTPLIHHRHRHLIGCYHTVWG